MYRFFTCQKTEPKTDSLYRCARLTAYRYTRLLTGQNFPCSGKPTSQFKGHATRNNDIVDDIVDVSSSTMAFNVAKIASARASLTISLTKSLRVAVPLEIASIVASRVSFES